MFTMSKPTDQDETMNQTENGNVTNIEDAKGSKKWELSMSESFDLMALIKMDYVASKMNDSEFAAYAMTKVKCRPHVLISPSQVKSRRDAFGIPSNVKVQAQRAQTADAAMVLKHDTELLELRARLMKVEAFINTNFPTVSGKKVVG